ncbi:MAG: sodium/solute symporter [Candidatus Lindowbacteria bacterium]|nr:sodium/solute symporter [Candidatus Lindowbacteria bacterium]
MEPLDWAVVGTYALIVIGLGVMATRKQKNTDEYFRGSRALPWWAIGISIIATAFSAASLLGGPGEGYSHGFLWLQLQLGDLLGYALVCAFFIPVYVKLNITTAYEYLEKRFDPKTRSLGAICFLLFVIVRLGALLYGASLVFSQIAGISIDSAIIAVGVVSIGYTIAGGLAAVIWTDVVQFFMIIIGVGVAIFCAARGVDGGFAGVIGIAAETRKLQAIDLSWNPSSIRSLPTATLAYGILALAVAGTNQQTVQRYVSCSDTKSAQKAAMLGWFTGFVGVAATLILGVFLFAFYSSRPGLLPVDIKPDKIFPFFIASELPPGVAGLLVAAVFAAAMSSIDSALHSLSTCIIVDFYKRHFKPNEDEAHYLKAARVQIAFWGIIGIGAAFYVARTGESLLPFLVKYTSYFIGPLLGLFVLGIACKRTNGNGAFWGALSSVAILLGLINYGPELIDGFKIPGIWYSCITASLTVIIGYLISLAGPAPDPDVIKELEA